MTPKEYLSQAYRIDMRIRSKQEQITSLNELATKCTSALTGMPKGSSCGDSHLASTVSKIIDLENSIADDMQRLVDLKAEIIGVINDVECVEYKLILEKRYICCKSWPEIAVELGYKMRHMYKLHDEALKAIKIPKKICSVQ